MKKVALLLAIVVAAMLILLPVNGRVNGTHEISVLDKVSLQADGGPLPSPIPPPHSVSTLTADGGPLPSPIPPGGGHIYIV
jgi:hypothetical protein